MDIPGIDRNVINLILDIHPSRNALVLHYELEVVAYSEYGEPMVADSKECVKIVNVENVTRATNIPSLAREVVANCPIIDEGKLPELEQLLLYMQARKRTKEGAAEKDVLEASTKKLQKQMEDLEGTEEASMIELDSYLEGLYEDLPSKVRVTGLILQLARIPDNLLELASNNSLILALTRVLREDWKKSIDLTTNIIYIFFCFSTFSDFHRFLIRHKIGSSCMSVVEHEMRRHHTLVEDVAKKRKEVKSGTTEAKKDYEKAKKRYQQLLKKQETLLRVALYLLLNLAEDTRVELKMRNKGLLPHLLTLLERDNQELLILVVSFLKKLSIFRENIDIMAEGDIIKKLMKVIPCNNEILVNVTLRLLLNLSFDANLRKEMIQAGFLPKLTALFGTDSHHTVVLCILYHISFDHQSRSVFAYTDCIPRLMKMILEYPEELLDPETISLGINLACTPFGAQQMCKGPGLKLLMRRALKTQDPLLLKMIRNISQHSGPTKKQFLGYIHDLAGLVKEGGDETVVEALGILGNLNLPELDFSKVVSDLQLLSCITAKLKDPGVPDDLLLEVVVVVGTFCLDEACAAMFVEAKLPDLLITILKAKQEDDELVLQIAYVFYHLILHQSTRDQVLTSTQAIDYLLELMNDKNKEICKLCSKILDIVVEHCPELGQRIKGERFRWHNSQWLEVVTGEFLYEEEEEDEDYMYHDHLHSAAELDNPEYYYSIPGPLEGPPVPEYGLSPTQHYYTAGGTSPVYPPPGVPLPPHNSPYGIAEGGRMNPVALGGGVRLQLGAVPEEVDVLSPHQYDMLMRSMEDPLAMYSASFGVDGDPPGPGDQRREWAGLEDRFEYDAASTNHPAFAVMQGGHYYSSSTNRKGF